MLQMRNAVLVVSALAAAASVVSGEVGLGVFLKDAATNDMAVCLDGTPGVYYIAKGTGDGVNKWYIHHEGGGWCVNNADCLGRSNTTLGSRCVCVSILTSAFFLPRLFKACECGAHCLVVVFPLVYIVLFFGSCNATA